MASIDPAYRNLIQFVPEKPGCSLLKTFKEKVPNTLSGQDAKNFYESVIGSSDLSTPTSEYTNSLSENPPVETAKGSNKCRHKKHSKNRRGIKSYNKSSINARCTNCDSLTSESIINERGNEKEITKGSLDAEKVETRCPITFSEKLTCSDRKNFSFLKAAQLGDLTKVCKLLEQGASLNYQDFYGWTALMCASREGHSQVVHCLLDRGADNEIVNNNGQSASNLASSAGHDDLAYIISTYSPSVSVSGASRDRDEDNTDCFYCSNCKDYFLEKEKEAHFTSTVHLLHSGRKHQHPAYLLPETNRGFQMLLRTGWQVDKGLGPEGKGMKYPVKTVLKRDREGLGNSSSVKKAKITHFCPHDKTAVSTVLSKPERNISSRKSTQYALRSKEKRQKRKEINFRLEFNDL